MLGSLSADEKQSQLVPNIMKSIIILVSTTFAVLHQNRAHTHLLRLVDTLCATAIIRRLVL
jgi:hypothetical protein